MRKKQAPTLFYEGMVSISSVKQHPQRPNFWNWQVGSFESERLLDWLGEHEWCLITQRERKTITGKAGLAPRVILVKVWFPSGISGFANFWKPSTHKREIIHLSNLEHNYSPPCYSLWKILMFPEWITIHVIILTYFQSFCEKNQMLSLLNRVAFHSSIIPESEPTQHQLLLTVE